MNDGKRLLLAVSIKAINKRGGMFMKVFLFKKGGLPYLSATTTKATTVRNSTKHSEYSKKYVAEAAIVLC